MLLKLDLQNGFKTFIFDNEYWYGNGPPSLDKNGRYNAWGTNFRQRQTIDLLRRDARQALRRGDDLLRGQFEALADKLSNCKRHQRCGSLGCLKCLRAAQRAKTAASKICIREIARHQPAGKKLVMVTCIPIWMRYQPTELCNLDLADRNEWLLQRLRDVGFNRPMLGSIDISWEKGFYQVHWHLATWTSNRIRLKERLKAIFPGDERHDRPVHVKKAYDLNFLGYTHKCIKSVDLLRRNRRGISHLLIMLDRTDPIDVMILTRLHTGVHNGYLRIEED
jgi:hypothetical protein